MGKLIVLTHISQICFFLMWPKRLNKDFVLLNTYKRMVSPCWTWTYVKKRAFWDIAPCNIVEVDRIFRDVLPPSTWRSQNVTLKSRSMLTRLHGTISQNAVFFKLAPREHYISHWTFLFVTEYVTAVIKI
jgi:hypothetical protein